MQKGGSLTTLLFFMTPGSLFFPSFQPFHSTREHPRHKLAVSVFNHFLAAKLLKFAYRSVKCEFAVLVAITAIFPVFAAVGIGSSALLVFCHRHSATLTKLVFCTHDLFKLLITYKLVLLLNLGKGWISDPCLCLNFFAKILKSIDMADFFTSFYYFSLIC